MARVRGKVTANYKTKSKGKRQQCRQSKLSRWLGRSASLDLAPDSEDSNESNHRKNLRWLHAGVYNDAQSENQDIWYAFQKKKNDNKYQIVYACDQFGSAHGNYDVGQIKRNLITFDEHHRKKWRRFLNSKGTWTYGNALKGRHLQRQTLLKTFFDPNFVDPYPNGRENKAVGPRLNVIHYINDKSGSAKGRMVRGASGSASATPTFTPPNQCYPDTNIPLSTEKIKIGAFRDINRNPLKLISNFLTGNLTYYPTGHVQRKHQLDQIESAFYDQGWRVDRVTVDRVLDDMQELGHKAFETNAFVQNLPIRVDQYKGAEVEKVMASVAEKPPSGDTNSNNDAENDPGDNDDDDPNSVFVGSASAPKSQGLGGAKKLGKKFLQDLARMMARRRNSNSARSSEQDDDSDSFDFLPEDSLLKGKGVASKKRLREELDEGITEGTQAVTEVQDNDYVDIDEERNNSAKRIKSEPPISRGDWGNPIVIDEDAISQDDSDVEFIEERPVVPKQESSYYH